jgi:hypothetical protein
MSAHAIPRDSVIRPHMTVTHWPSRTLTWAAHLVWLGYVLWLPAMHALALSLYDLIGIEPGAGQNLTSNGLVGYSVNLAFMLVLALPLWLGAGLAVAALRRGADGPALAALMLNLGLAVMLVVFGVLVPF